MLVLSRKNGESIVFPTLGIELVIVETKGERVRVGIAAPKEIPVHRSEVHRANLGRAAAKAAK